MENKYNNTVIKVLTKVHGKEVIKWWQSVGVDTRNTEGKVTDYCYGIVNNRFDIVSFDFAIFSKLKIIELPKIGERKLKIKENMENLIGRKCKGFEFKGNLGFVQNMAEHIGKTGTIEEIISESIVRIRFRDDELAWNYPISEIRKHLIPLEDEIPTLGEGKLMLVSDDEIIWNKRMVYFKSNSKYYVKYNKDTFTFSWWNFAKKIETEEIVEDVLVHLTLKDISEGKGVGVKPSLIRIKE